MFQPHTLSKAFPAIVFPFLFYLFYLCFAVYKDYCCDRIRFLGTLISVKYMSVHECIQNILQLSLEY